MAMTGFSVFFPMIITSSFLGFNQNIYHVEAAPCFDSCSISLVESIPQNLTYEAGSPSHMSTYDAWMSIIQAANTSIDIASLYWTLRGQDFYKDPSDWQGESIYKELLKAGTVRKIKVRIAQSAPSSDSPDHDTADLAKAGAAQVRSVNFTRLLSAGVLHTKLWLVDGKHFYVGSANMDWRSLTQVKEMGVVGYNCGCLAKDMSKLFSVYWYLGPSNSTIPKKWPASLSTRYNKATPMSIKINATESRVYFSSSPKPLCPFGRTADIDAILDVIHKAQHYVHIAVMDYYPLVIYRPPLEFWPVIDDALKKAAIERGVEVKLLASWWNHSRPFLPDYLKSLSAISSASSHINIEVKLFHVPAFTKAQAKIPFARVNHNKYMVTDNQAYIGTSNWSGDYFIDTGGVAFVVNQTTNGTGRLTNNRTLQQQLEAVFIRDWNSIYALPIKEMTKKFKLKKSAAPTQSKRLHIYV